MIILDWRYFCRRYLFDAYETTAPAPAVTPSADNSDDEEGTDINN